MTICPRCQGGRTFSAFVDGPSGGRYEPALLCGLCQGTGEVPEKVAEWLAKGTAHRLDRVARGVSIGQAAKCLGITAAQLSAMEHGRADPVGLNPTPPPAPRNARTGRGG